MFRNIKRRGNTDDILDWAFEGMEKQTGRDTKFMNTSQYILTATHSAHVVGYAEMALGQRYSALVSGKHCRRGYRL